MQASRKTHLAVLAFLFPLAVLLCQLQYESSRRPGIPPIFEMYMRSDLSLLFTSRVLPRLGILAIHGLSGGRLSYAHANALLQLTCIWATLFLVFRFARTYLAPMPALAATFLAAIFPIWGFLEVAGYCAYPYDFPAFLFSTAGLLAIARRRYAWLVVVVLLGTTNRESVVWLVPAFFFVNARPGVRVRWLLVSTTLLGLLFAGTYELTRVLFDPAHTVQVTVQPTGPAGARYVNNLRDLLFLNQRNIYTNVWYPFALHAPAVLFFSRLHGDLRRLYWAVPFLLLPIFFFGNIGEAQYYNEIGPLGAVSAVYLFARLWGETARGEAEACGSDGARCSDEVGKAF